MEKRFTSDFNQRKPAIGLLVIGLIGLLYGSIGYPLSCPMTHGEIPWRFWSGVLFITSGYGLIATAGIVTLLLMRTVYTVDAEGILCEGVFSRQHLWWSEIVRVRTDGSLFNPPVLYGVGGEAIRLWYDCLRPEDRAALKSLLDEKLEPLLSRTSEGALANPVKLSHPSLQSIVGVFLMVLIPLLLGMMGPMVWQSAYFIYRCNVIDRQGVFAHGIVTKKTDGCLCSTEGNFEIEYTFIANGRKYRHTSPGDKNTYLGTRVGERLPIRYLAETPWENRAVASTSHWRVLHTLLALVISLTATLLLIPYRLWRRKMTCAKERTSANPA